MRRRKRTEPIKKMGSKLFIMLFLFLFSLAGLIGRVYYLKTVKGAEYETKAKEQQVSRYDSVIPPNRGAIVDRNNQALAISVTVFNVVLDARVLSQATADNQEKTLKALAETFPDQLDYATLKQYITINPSTNKPNLDSNWKVLVKGIDTKTKEELQEKVYRGGVVFEQASKRTYPGKTLACHVIGFGQMGIESQYNQFMTGTPGRSFISYDGGDTAVGQDHPAKDGDTVVTTLDYTIQQLAEQVVAEVALEWPSQSVGTIVMNPNTGEVYAMTAANMFDLNEPSDPIGLANEEFRKGWDLLTKEQRSDYRNKMWRNFNISDTYEPGSTFKAITAAAAYEESIVNQNSTFYCSGMKKVADREIKCHLHIGHGTQTIQQALANSCNVTVMEIAAQLGKDKFYKYQRDFGFGEKTGIDLPGEVSDYSHVMFTPDRIGPTELATMSFGQSFNCTSIQMINAFSAVINGGKLMKPYVVSRIMDSDGNVKLENKPEIVRRVISQETSDYLRTAMKETVETGTGKKMKIEGYSIGAKTGTSEQGSRQRKDLWTLSAVAYFPVENPQYVVMTVIHRPDNYVDGLQTPVPMTKKLIEGIIKYKNLEPSYAVEGKAENKQEAAEKVTIDDFTSQSLANAVGALSYQNLRYKVVGTGNTITSQVPKGGTSLDEGSEVILYVQKAEGEEGFVAVPDVMGKDYTESVTLLNDAGFEVSFTGETDGVVIGQEPKYGVSVEKGTEIIISLGKPAEEENSTQENETSSQSAATVNTQKQTLPFAKLPEPITMPSTEQTEGMQQQEETPQ